MEINELRKLATTMGLSFSRSSNYIDNLKKGLVVFDGCNGQRFSIDTNWSDEKIYKTIGESLILMGKRLKSVEINRVISINSD